MNKKIISFPKRLRKKYNKPQRIKVPLPERFHKFFYLVAVCQGMHNINPIEVMSNVVAFINDEAGVECLEDSDRRSLRQYLLQWGIVDFTRTQKGEANVDVQE